MSMAFEAGEFYITAGVDALVKDSRVELLQLLARHMNGDWGDVCEEDKQSNNEALLHGNRLLSSYSLCKETVWIITEADRSATTILLPSEY